MNKTRLPRNNKRGDTLIGALIVLLIAVVNIVLYAAFIALIVWIRRDGPACDGCHSDE